MGNNDNMNLQIQSNSLRGEFMHSIVDRTVQEILDDISPMFGPWATDAFITKNGQPYYTRDGKEVMESLLFDNELALYVHHIFYQAVVNQGAKVGDGSTTVAVFYSLLYKFIRNNKNLESMNLNELRSEWKKFIDCVKDELKSNHVAKMDKDMLLSMLYTCTQDGDLADKLFTNLGDALMAGAYIVPRKSNISTDFKATIYNRPTYKATRQFSLFPAPDDTIKEATTLYCHGSLDICHMEVLAAIAAVTGFGQYAEARKGLPPFTVVILCHGITDRTRKTLRDLVDVARSSNWNASVCNNIIIYTMDEYRKFDSEEFEDISTFLTDEPGMGGLVQSLTFETLLYKTFTPYEVLNGCEKIQELETLDIDSHLIDKMKEVFGTTYEIMIDPIEGIALCKNMGPNSSKRYNELRREIEEEKSAVRKADLNRRLRRCYGMFIDIEVGSTLLKDSQRKFELILDAVLSASDAAQDGVLIGNSIIHAIRAICIVLYKSSYTFNQDITHVISSALEETLRMMLENNGQSFDEGYITQILHRIYDAKYDVAAFNIKNFEDIWPSKDDIAGLDPAMIRNDVTIHHEDGEDIVIDPIIIEPVGIINAILDNSILPFEVAKTEVFHISGKAGFMGNYIN